MTLPPQAAKRTGQPPHRRASTTPDERPLSPRRAFVVQFREESAGADGRFAGRVEHTTSGQAARFESLDDLLAFLKRVLRGERSKVSDRE